MCEEEVTGTLPLLRRMLLTSNTCRYSQTQLHDGETGEVEGNCGEWGLGWRENTFGNGEFTSDFMGLVVEEAL